MEVLKIYYLTGDNLELAQLLKDKSLKKHIEKSTTFDHNLIVKFYEQTPDSVVSYFTIKYGDNIKNINDIIPDRTPVMYVDYMPKRD